MTLLMRATRNERSVFLLLGIEMSRNDLTDYQTCVTVHGTIFETIDSETRLKHSLSNRTGN
jgi:hypothetical protein